MTNLTGSVGRGGLNRPDDVRVVQQLLNAVLPLLPPAERLVEDGLAGNKTSALIAAFQLHLVGLVNPDGRIDPGGKTWQALVARVNPVQPAKLFPAPNPKLPVHVQAFIAGSLPAAQQVKADWGVPIAICLAQAALESGWGRSVKDNAYFGIKGKSLTGSSTDFTTTEFIDGKKITITDRFRAYTDFAEAAEDYGRFLATNPRYEGCFEQKDDPLAFADALQAAGYATDPAYADKIKRLIQANGLLGYDVA